jgi:hypothetical protein
MVCASGYLGIEWVNDGTDLMRRKMAVFAGIAQPATRSGANRAKKTLKRKRQPKADAVG